VSGLPFVAQWRNAIRDGDLDPRSKLVAFTLSTYMNGAGECYPARASLAVACCCSVKTVDRAVVRIESAGLLDVSRDAGRGRSNRYRATLNGVTGDAIPDEKRGHSGPEKASSGTVKGVTGDPRKRVKASEGVSTRAGARAGRRMGRANAHPDDNIDDDLLAYDH
jgi:hypothetical protein